MSSDDPGLSTREIRITKPQDAALTYFGLACGSAAFIVLSTAIYLVQHHHGSGDVLGRVLLTLSIGTMLGVGIYGKLLAMQRAVSREHTAMVEKIDEHSARAKAACAEIEQLNITVSRLTDELAVTMDEIRKLVDHAGWAGYGSGVRDTSPGDGVVRMDRYVR
jgi:hypothetical protein